MQKRIEIYKYLSCFIFYFGSFTLFATPICEFGNCENGKGILIFDDKSKYVGDFTNGIPNGYGIWYLSNGNKQQGFWVDGKIVKEVSNISIIQDSTLNNSIRDLQKYESENSGKTDLLNMIIGFMKKNSLILLGVIGSIVAIISHFFNIRNNLKKKS